MNVQQVTLKRLNKIIILFSVVTQNRGAQISDVKSPVELHFVGWRLISMGPQYGISRHLFGEF
jgi:hypothetical protein